MLRYIQYIRRTIAEVSSGLIRVAVNQTETFEVGGGSEDWKAVGVPNDLGKVVVDDRGRDDVSSSREVDDGRRGRGRLALPWSTSVSAANGVVDGCGIVGDTITWNPISIRLVLAADPRCWAYLWHQSPSHCGRLGSYPSWD